MKYGLPNNDYSVSVSPNAKIASLSSTLPDYKNNFRAPFREWAENALPGKHESHLIYCGLTRTDCPVRSPRLDRAADMAGNQQYMVNLQEDGSPHLPAFDVDLVAPTDARSMLKAYIELTWGESSS
jgi:hypothetical protein